MAFEKYGKEVFYAQMLGKNGTLHVQWFTDPVYKKDTAVKFENLLSGVEFDEIYFDSNAIAQMHEKRAGESSKFVFIFGGLALFIYIIRKMLIKPSSE